MSHKLGSGDIFFNLILYGNKLHDVDHKNFLFIGVSIIIYSIFAIMLPEPHAFLNSMVDDISKLVWLIFLFDHHITFQLFSTEGRPFSTLFAFILMEFR